MIPSIDPEMELDENAAEILRSRGLPTRLQIALDKFKGYTKEDLVRVIIELNDRIILMEQNK